MGSSAVLPIHCNGNPHRASTSTLSLVNCPHIPHFAALFLGYFRPAHRLGPVAGSQDELELLAVSERDHFLGHLIQETEYETIS